MEISCIILIGEKFDKDVFKKCLESVSWCDEIVKIDTTRINGSFSEWRNEGVRKAKGEWLLYVDTDEVVTNLLKEEIKEKIKSTEFVCYAIPRRNFIFEKEFKHSGQYPDYQKRLINKNKFIKWVGNVHEEPRFDGKMGHLKNPLNHYKTMTISEMIDKTNKWSELEADLLYKSNHPKMNFIRFFTAGLREFWLRMIVQLSFLDGKEGIVYAFYQVYSRLITYSKLWEKQLL